MRNLTQPDLALLAFAREVQENAYAPYSGFKVGAAVYAFGELLGSIEQNVLNRVAQKFIYHLRNQTYHKLQSQSLGYLQRQRTGDSGPAYAR